MVGGDDDNDNKNDVGKGKDEDEDDDEVKEIGGALTANDPECGDLPLLGMYGCVSIEQSWALAQSQSKSQSQRMEPVDAVAFRQPCAASERGATSPLTDGEGEGKQAVTSGGDPAAL